MRETGEDGAPVGPNRPASDALYRSLVTDAFDMIVTLSHEGTITYANDACRTVLGHGPSYLIGRSVFDILHPDDAERALQGIATQAEFGAPQGTSSFRLRHEDGSWVWADVTASDITDGAQSLIGIHCRPAEDRQAVDEVLIRLLHGASRRDLLAPVCDFFAWRLNGSRVGISWSEPGGPVSHVSTDLPAALVGADDPAGGPWEVARRDLTDQHDGAASLLDPIRRSLADSLGLRAYWIVPVPDVGGRRPALITVWGGPSGRPPEGHAYGMGVARTFVELILRWSHQVQELDSAAHTDPLTRLANRKAFFDRLDATADQGALLYCDLDRFKPVNDELGHAAGDELLRQVASRLRRTVRADDLVARLGGDEFAILCEGASPSQADELADRIVAAFITPFTIDGRAVDVGISIGIGHAADRLGDDTLEAADQALYRVKARRRAGDGLAP